MGWEVNGRHVALLEHTFVVHDTVILPAVASSGVKEEDLLRPVSSLFVEALASAPQRRSNVGVPAYDLIIIELRFSVRWCLPNELVVQKLQNTAPDVSPSGCKQLICLGEQPTYQWANAV